MTFLGQRRIQQRDVAIAMQKAIKSGKERDIQEAWLSFMHEVAAEVTDNIEAQNLENIQMTKTKNKKLNSTARNYYQSLANHLKAKQSIAPADVVMPQTEVDRITDNMVTASPLLDKINFVPGGDKYLTKYVVNAKGVQKGTWGEVTSAIVTELLNSYKVIDITQNKLSCYGQISVDMLDLGPTFLSSHIEQTLLEGVVTALEEAVVNGTGKDQPIGLTRNLKGTVTNGVYPQKTKVAITDLSPKTYGGLIKLLSKDENGRVKKFDRVSLIVNKNTYLEKILPATTVLDPLSELGYKINSFPYPTDVFISEALQDNEAILCILDEYLLASGLAPQILHSDEYKFIEDLRVYKCRCFFEGRAVDNNTSVFLDISGLDELIPRVKTITDATVTNTDSKGSE